MAAGQGFKTFTTGEVLTAGDVNGYLMQGINVFASTAARDAAITAPAEGQFAFTKDTNSLWYYDGAAWVASGATGDIEGVTAGVGISGGGTSGTVTVTNSMATAIDAKGDLVPGTGADTFARLAVGANDTVLTADSSAATGLKWAGVAAAGANWTLLNSGGTSLSGSITTISGISGKDKIMILWENASGNDSSLYATLYVRFNEDSGSNYTARGLGISGAVNYNANIFNSQVYTDAGVRVGQMGDTHFMAMSGYLLVTGCNSSGTKVFNNAGSAEGGTQTRAYITGGNYNSSSTISSVSLRISGGSFDTGTVFVYTSA
jgi:hypothetical protein